MNKATVNKTTKQNKTKQNKTNQKGNNNKKSTQNQTVKALALPTTKMKNEANLDVRRVLSPRVRCTRMQWLLPFQLKFPSPIQRVHLSSVVAIRPKYVCIGSRHSHYSSEEQFHGQSEQYEIQFGQGTQQLFSFFFFFRSAWIAWISLLCLGLGIATAPKAS